MAERSKILIIGSTGYIGKFWWKQAQKLGIPHLLWCEGAVPVPPPILTSQTSSNTSTILALFWFISLVKAIEGVDVVISAVGFPQLADQTKIIAAIKQAGNVKPSEFGNDSDRVHAVEPAKGLFAIKAQIRRAAEAEGIPYTFVTTISPAISSEGLDKHISS
ncbi:hypothetical protein ACLOJK_001802 [Asimina triloba]